MNHLESSSYKQWEDHSLHAATFCIQGKGNGRTSVCCQNYKVCLVKFNTLHVQSLIICQIAVTSEPFHKIPLLTNVWESVVSYIVHFQQEKLGKPISFESSDI